MKNYIDLAFFTIGENYLHTVKNILTENIDSGNTWIVSNEITDKDYDKHTKRSDFNVFIPTIFLLYHGLELILKGILKLQGQEFKPNHKISKLYEEIKNNNKNIDFVKKIEKYIEKDSLIPLIGNFLNKNNKTIDSFYEIFRYPSNKDENELHKYFELKYNEEFGILFSRQVVEDVEFIRRWIVTTYKKRNK